jgi:hypothetical protein
MATAVEATVAASNGQQSLRGVKSKEMRFSSKYELEKYIHELIKLQEDFCVITGLRLQYPGDYDDKDLLCSLDRIDSDGHYEAGNLQVVCRFVNRWKNDSNDAEFRRLIGVVRSIGGI